MSWFNNWLVPSHLNDPIIIFYYINKIVINNATILVLRWSIYTCTKFPLYNSSKDTCKSRTIVPPLGISFDPGDSSK